ncbi:MAG: DUF2079 domain-containing protein [Ruminococcus sp.]|nr:DUF2079 domain-containing protein [Ruminococcus sp.]
MSKRKKSNHAKTSPAAEENSPKTEIPAAEKSPPPADDTAPRTEEITENPDNPESTDGADNADNTEITDNPENAEINLNEAPPQKLTFRLIIERIKNFLEKFGIPDMLLIRFLTAYFFVAGYNLTIARSQEIDPINGWKDYVETNSLLKSFLIILVIFLLYSIIYDRLPKKARYADHIGAIIAIIFFDLELLWNIDNFQFSMAVACVSAVFIYYILGKSDGSKLFRKLSWKISGIFVLLVTGLMIFFISLTTICHHKVFGTSAFDFGIFVQMYHSLAENLTAVTTCERDKPLSHFYVHASYIYYILVPFYKLFPKEETLLIAQAVLAMGGAVPTFMIAKNHDFKGISLIGVCFMYIFCSGLILPNYYDFHENAFLPTLLMFMIWAADSKKYKIFFVFAALVCIVKEETSLYVVCVSMMMFFANKGDKKRWLWLISTVVSGVYMTLITRWLTKNGDGEMMTSYRFGKFLINDGDGLGSIVKNVLTDPGYFFSSLIRESNLLFFVEVMFPLLFLPFFTKKIERYFLMLPFIITNLTIGASYGYAENISFQYIFGPVCPLIYMSIINLDDINEKKQDIAFVSGITSLIIAFGWTTTKIRYYERYKEDEAHFKNVEALLDGVPKDAAVASEAFLLPHMADRDRIYLLDMNDAIKNEDDPSQNRLTEPGRYEYLVFNYNSEIHNLCIPIFEEMGFSLYSEIPEKIVIYHNDRFDEAEWYNADSKYGDYTNK